MICVQRRLCRSKDAAAFPTIYRATRGKKGVEERSVAGLRRLYRFAREGDKRRKRLSPSFTKTPSSFRRQKKRSENAKKTKTQNRPTMSNGFAFSHFYRFYLIAFSGPQRYSGATKKATSAQVRAFWRREKAPLQRHQS